MYVYLILCTRKRRGATIDGSTMVSMSRERKTLALHACTIGTIKSIDERLRWKKRKMKREKIDENKKKETKKGERKDEVREIARVYQ